MYAFYSDCCTSSFEDITFYCLYFVPPETLAVLCIMSVCKEDKNIYLDSAEWTKHGPGNKYIGVGVYWTPRLSFHAVMVATLPLLVYTHEHDVISFFYFIIYERNVIKGNLDLIKMRIKGPIICNCIYTYVSSENST